MENKQIRVDEIVKEVKDMASGMRSELDNIMEQLEKANNESRKRAAEIDRLGKITAEIERRNRRNSIIRSVANYTIGGLLIAGGWYAHKYFTDGKE